MSVGDSEKAAPTRVIAQLAPLAPLAPVGALVTIGVQLRPHPHPVYVHVLQLVGQCVCYVSGRFLFLKECRARQGEIQKKHITAISICVVPCRQCPTGSRSMRVWRKLDSLAEPMTPAGFLPWLMWRCSREEVGPLWHNSGWITNQDQELFIDQRCKYSTVCLPRAFLSYTLV